MLAVHLIKLTAVYSCPLPPHADPLTIYPTQQPILNTVSQIGSLNITDRVSQSQNNQHNYICVYLIFNFLLARLKFWSYLIQHDRSGVKKRK